MNKLILVLLALIVSNFSYAADCESDANYGEVTKAELQKMITDKKVFLVDVNSKESFAKQSIPGAIHYGSQTDYASALPKDKNALIVAYCGGTMCTAWKQAAIAACKLNYKNIKHFKPGISGWAKAS